MKAYKYVTVIFLIWLGLQWQCSLPTAADITPPIVLIIYPYEGSVLSGTVTIAVESTDEKEVTKVWYYIDGTITESSGLSNPRFQLNVVPLADDRTHILMAGATDKAGNVGYSIPVAVIFSNSDDNTPPVVNIVNPVSGQVVEGIVQILAAADDDRLVREVVFFIDGDSVRSDLIYPYQYDWNTQNLSDSTSHTIFAKAYDNSNNWALSPVIEVTVFPRSRDIMPPVLALLHPLAGSMISGTVDVTVDASDNVGVTNIEFFVDGGDTAVFSITSPPWIYPWDTTPWADDAVHTLYIKAYDAAGNIGTLGPLTFTINVNADIIPPTVLLLYPPASSSLSGTVNVAVDASDNVGVTRVEFYVDGGTNGNPNFSKTSPPWIYAWNTAPWANGGQHTLYIKAYDQAGNTTAVGPVTYTIP